MIIKQRDITNFNNGIEPSFNENANKARGIYNLDVYLMLKAVKNAKWGMLSMPITLKHVKELYYV